MMIQDIEPHRLLNQFDPAAVPTSQDSVLVLRGQQILADISGEVRYPQVKDLPENALHNLLYLFAVDDERYFLYTGPDPAISGYVLTDLKALREAEPQPKYRVYAALTGKHLSDWYRDTRFCGRCGQAMKHSLQERAMVCSICGYTAYPRIMPAVIVGVLNREHDKLLLTQYRRGYNHNALIAGFT